MGGVLEYIERSLPFEISDASFDTNPYALTFKSIHGDSSKILLNFYVSDSRIDSCHFIGPQRHMTRMFTDYFRTDQGRSLQTKYILGDIIQLKQKTKETFCIYIRPMNL